MGEITVAERNCRRHRYCVGAAIAADRRGRRKRCRRPKSEHVVARRAFDPFRRGGTGVSGRVRRSRRKDMDAGIRNRIDRGVSPGAGARSRHGIKLRSAVEDGDGAVWLGRSRQDPMVAAAATWHDAGNCWRHRRRRVDLQGAGRIGHDAGQIGVVARDALNRRPVEVERGNGKVAGVLPGRNRIAEGQRVGSGAADIACRSTAVQHQRRCAARNGDGFAQCHSQRDNMTCIEIAIAVEVDARTGCCDG